MSTRQLHENIRILQRGSILLIGVVIAGNLFPDAGQAQGLVIGHNCTDISKVPATWIQQAKTQCRIGYGHTSHGSQLVTGIATLYAQLGSPYDYTSSSSGLVPGRFLNDYWASGDLGTGGDLTWRDATVEMLNMPGNDRNVVMWSWCGGVSGNTAGDINAYLQAMNELEQMWPDVTFIYMTGHLDGTGVSGNLNQMNELIRQFCLANNKTLFDFADIESYDPDGSEFLSRDADDGCNYSGGNWANEWSAAHPDDPLCANCSCAHSQPLNCNLKGRAFWWMMARLAGWSGSDTNLPAPAGVSASDGTFSNMVQLSWNAVADAVEYEVWRHTSSNSGSASQISSSNPTGTSYDDISATAGIMYYYWVKALNPNSTSCFSGGNSGYCGSINHVVGPVIKANGYAGDISINRGANLSIAVQIDPGEYDGINVDWWIITLAGSSWYYLNSAIQWTPFEGNLLNCHPVLQGPLFNLPATEVLNMTGLSTGSYTFWFAVDSPMDGILNLDGPVLVDAANVTVQ